MHENLVPFIRKLLQEAGQAPGSVEVVKTPVKRAEDYAEKECQKQGKSLDDIIPNFVPNFQKAQSLAKMGHTKRKDMPVIDEPDVKTMQRRFKAGSLDVKKPHSPETEETNPFPEGLTGEEAEKFLVRGFHDRNLRDDRIDLRMTKVTPGDLKPIQKQIYLDKAMPEIVKHGVDGTLNFLRKSITIISSDNRIIDGHHRWLSGMLLDPNLKVNGLQIDLPINILLDLLVAYGDAIGNKRNL